MIPNCWVRLENGRVISKMMNSSRNAILFLNKENNIIPEIDDVDLYFKEPNQNLKPYLDLLEDDSEVKINDSKMTLYSGGQTTNIFFCTSDFVNIFTGNDPNVDIFYNVGLSEISNDFGKLRKVANKFGKMYFTVQDGKMIMETTDKTNPYSNSLSFTIGEVDKKDLYMYFDFKIVNSLFNIIEPERFNLNFTYLDEQEAGMIIVESEDGSEKYCIPSSQE